MILKASQRSGGKQLAFHLGREDQNDHVEVHQLRGFISDDLEGALREVYAISRGTKCRQYLFSLSLSPPETATVAVKDFERAIGAIEERLGLKGQPRAIVFHEKEGRRHAHCVWSRINAATMKAINLPYFKLSLQDLSRDLYLEHGWKMPPGLVKSEERNPLNFSREEWQQAQRIGRDPRTIKDVFQDCWAISDSAKAFAQALEARGYYLARGDRRGFVAADFTGEVYSISRWASVKTKALAARLGDPDDLPSVEEVKKQISERVAAKLNGFADEVRREFADARSGLYAQKKQLVQWQRHERKLLSEIQAVRWIEESRDRYERFRRGLRGLWDRITGRHARIAAQNQAECLAAETRDMKEHDDLVAQQLADRRSLQRQIKEHQQRQECQLSALYPTRNPAPGIRAPSPRQSPRASLG